MTAVASSLDAAEETLRRIGGLVALIAFVAALAGIGRGMRRARPQPVDRRGATVEVGSLVAATAGFLGASALLWQDLPVDLGPRTRVLAATTGSATLFSGLGIYLAGMAALGREYDVSSTFGARLYRDQGLVTSGPYSVVRHPMYVGAMIAAVGALVLYRTWTTLGFVAALPVLVVRARREEDVLAERFGSEWTDYRQRVPAWLPRVSDRG